MPSKTMITAHAGAEGTTANTLDSIREQIACDVDAIEIDVRQDAQGALLLSHNPMLPDEHYDTLSDCLTLVKQKDGLLINIDLKEEGLVEPVYHLAQSLGAADRLVFTGSVNADDLSFAREKNLPVWYNSQLLSENELLSPLTAVRAKGLSMFNTHHKLVTDEMLAQDAPFFSVWTVDHEEDLRRFLSAGVGNITTRIPRLARKLRAEICQ